MNLDRNIVIEASAGTGKTYTLVQTILQALFEKNLKMDELVALTFTKKAAGEMKERIAAELQKVDSPQAREALEAIDRAAIGTIHSFAFSLLKRFPLEAGISPEAEVDDKDVRADDLFEKEWPIWLRRQLSADSSQLSAKEWLEVLKQVTLSDIRELARLLCDFNVPLDALPCTDGPVALTTLLKPFALRFRQKLLAEGILSNNALLVLARNLVADNPKVRETLKREIRMIFVDEFQDTDPLQGELLLYLAERMGTQAKAWKHVKFEPGKLFIVGDPKQSIYRFRGADISAYSGITNMVIEQGGMRHTLEVSYRSQAQIVHLANAAFRSLIQEEHPISPAYQPLTPKRPKEDGGHHDVELRLAAASDDEPQSSEKALVREAEDAAEWIATKKGIAFKDIALIFRSTPGMPPFIDALRRRHIPFVVEGERYFFHTPEVTDVLNLLRVIDNSKDRTALVGVLRSPLAGMTDKEIVALKQADWKRPGLPILLMIDALHKRSRHEPLKSILSHVYEDTYLLELAARSYHKDQTIANLLKLKRLMESFAEEGETSLSGLLAKINRFMEDDRLEGESPLADETYDAVRLLTIHKAKGLEFPVVWLPGLHRGRQPNRAGDRTRIRYDWSTGRLGVKVCKELRNAEDLALEEEARTRDEAEERRILYVAMTRARDRLILSGGIHLKRPFKDSFLNLLAGAWKLNLDSIMDGDIKIGESTLSIRHVIGEGTKPAATPAPAPSWLDKLEPARFAKMWKEREKRREKAMETPLVVTPTSIQSGEHLAPSTESKHTDSLFGARYSVLQLGTLVHRFLESWDFACEKCDMPARLRVVANHYFASEGLLKEPFPDPKNASPRGVPVPLPMGEGGRRGDPGEANPPELVEVVEEAQRLLADFIGSEAWEEIKNSEILGREVPFFCQVDGALMRGSIDILYRTSKGQLVIGDYKTDLELDPERYAEQGKAYEEAVSRALGEKPIFKLIHLREGCVVKL